MYPSSVYKPIQRQPTDNGDNSCSAILINRPWTSLDHILNVEVWLELVPCIVSKGPGGSMS